MAFQRVPFCAEADILWVYQARILQNTPVFKWTAGLYTLANLQTLADTIGTWVNTYHKPLADVDLVFASTEAHGLNDENDLVAISLVGAGGGTAVGDMLPVNCTQCIKLSTGFTGRSARGRWFVLGMNDSHLNAANKDTTTTTFRTAWITALDALRTATLATGWQWVVASRYHLGAKRAEATTRPVIFESFVNTEVDSQRGRLPQ